MDLSQFLIMEQSLFHLWCHPKRHSRALPFPPEAVSFSRQSSKPGMCCLMSHLCQPQSGIVAAQGEEPPLPRGSSHHVGAGTDKQGSVQGSPTVASSKSSALPTRLQEKSYHMYKTKSFSYCNLCFPAPEAFVSKQDASFWGERQWCGSAPAAEAPWKWCNSWVVALFPPALPLNFIIMVQWHLFVCKCSISCTARLFYKETSKLKLYVR